jgi:hypothetical protein
MSCSALPEPAPAELCTGRSRTRRPPDSLPSALRRVRSRLAAAAARPAASRRSGYWSGLRALRKRGFIDDHPDAIRLRTPRRALPALLTPGLCRRSLAGGDRWHIRQPVPAARFTAVLPRGSGGSHNRRSPPEPAGGWDTAEGSGFGGPATFGGGRREPGGSGLAAGGAGQGRGRPPPATRRHLCPGPLRHGRSGPGLSRIRHAHRPALPEPRRQVVYRQVEDSAR